MSHKNRNNYNNYSKMSAANAANEPVVNESELAPIVEPEVLDEEIVVVTGPVIIEESETIEEDPIIPAPEEPIDGIVSGCTRLNVRAKPSLNASIIDIANAGDSLLIIDSKSTDDWYCVDAFGNEGYCMKKFVALKK